MGHTDIMTIAKFFVSSRFTHSGYEYVNSDEGWEEKARDNTTGKIVPTPKFGGSDAGMKKLVAEIHSMGLKIGLYGAASGVTCGNMPGQLYNEDIDAQTYADWGIDYREHASISLRDPRPAATRATRHAYIMSAPSVRSPASRAIKNQRADHAALCYDV